MKKTEGHTLGRMLDGQSTVGVFSGNGSAGGHHLSCPPPA